MNLSYNFFININKLIINFILKIEVKILLKILLINQD